MSNGQLKDPDDFFAETRMSFGDHIEELRTHLWRAIYGFLIALFFSFFLGKYVMNLITAPVKAQLDRFYERRVRAVLAEKKGTGDKLTQAAPFRKRWFLRQDLEDVAKGRAPGGKRPVLMTPEQAEREANPPPRWRRW